MVNMPFYLIDPPCVVVIAFVFGHTLEVFAVDVVHLLLVVLAVAALGLCHRLDLLANAT